MDTASPKSRPAAQGSSSQDRSLIPVGMATILPHAAKQVRSLESKLLAQLARWGYDEIILPTFEYLDVLAPGLEAELLETCYQFVDRTTGRTLLLRPDATAQVARTVAMGLLGMEIPQRLSYCTSVFRYEPEHAGRGREIFQVGAELIGVADAAADSEVLTMLIECLHAIGLPAFTIAIGHVGFMRALMARSGLSPQGQRRAEQAAARKDLPRLEEILTGERVAKSAARAICEAPELSGREEVLHRGKKLAAGEPALTGPLERLSEVYQSLCSAGHRESLLLDLGEFRGFDYYDGVVFDVFAPGVGSELGGGGRYDHLIGRFGRALPSTGFALDVDRLFRALKFPDGAHVSPHLDYLVVGSRRTIRLVSEIAARLRQGSRRVAQQALTGRDDSLIDNAIITGQGQRAGMVVVVGMPGHTRDEVTVIGPICSPVDPRGNGRSRRFPRKKMNVGMLLKTGDHPRAKGKS
ncbi:MAG TPA: ATP phosphoribosyltransferase regulatory subunit [Nitrospira sp.]|nr:ATP phosphoribosyltransferase regulatory subunit [Nitrospira sp.]